LLIVVVAEHRARRRAARDRVAEETEQAQHGRAIRPFAEDRSAAAVDELAALRPEHGEVIEYGRLPASGVVQIAGHTLLLRDAARSGQQLGPGARRHRDEIL